MEKLQVHCKKCNCLYTPHCPDCGSDDSKNIIENKDYIQDKENVFLSQEIEKQNKLIWALIKAAGGEIHISFDLLSVADHNSIATDYLDEATMCRVFIAK